MNQPLTRRSLSALGMTALPAFNQTPPAVDDSFPTQPPALVREMVGVSHGNVKRVRELVDARPSLAKASWDWGFGDWETALGAASHVGNREIAGLLLERGAPPTLFSATMLGQLDVVKAMIAAQPGVQRVTGPHSISLLAHARAGGPAAEPVLRFLESLGDAASPPATPLTAAEMSALAGNYVYGAGPTERIQIAVTRGSLTFLRAGQIVRGLVPLGGREFHPVGASAVRVRFSGGDTPILTVHDPEVVVKAARASSP